jgi:hypothetical protein
LCRRSIFDFARIKREDLFEVVALQQQVPQRPSKIKNTRIQDTTVQQVLCLFLAWSRKMVAKALDFAK